MPPRRRHELTDERWALIASLMPKAERGGAVEDLYAHQDDLFSVYAVTEGGDPFDASDDADNGLVVERYVYGDYGKRTALDASGAQLTTPALVAHGFTGRLHDPVSGLVEYRHRWMWAEARRGGLRTGFGCGGWWGRFGRGGFGVGVILVRLA